jgi:hypothetical protein
MLAHLLGKVIRSHWAIENSLHWIMDMVFRDDECRVRINHAPANFTTIEHMACNLHRKPASPQAKIHSASGARLPAGTMTSSPAQLKHESFTRFAWNGQAGVARLAAAIVS